MSSNSIQLLEDILQQKREEIAPQLREDEFFEFFCVDQILKDYRMSYEEIFKGIVDGTGDNGADAIYTFVNGDLVQEDFDPSPFKTNVQIDLHIIQAKTKKAFTETAIDKLTSFARRLFDLSVDVDRLENVNEDVKSEIGNFRRAYRSLASRFPDLRIRYYLATKKADNHVHPNTKEKAKELTTATIVQFDHANVDVQFVTAQDLINFARKRPKVSYELKVSKSLSAAKGYIALTNLRDFFDFLKEGPELFEDNIRDFEGDNEVNQEILDTLKTEKRADFWWMNNGITILATRATQDSDQITIENPQIVNGLQTSSQVKRFFEQPDLFSRSEENRSIMVKIISSSDDETRDKIIKATNSQTSVKPSSLRATDPIQRDIEQRLKTAELYYDRRKNYYKNLGKPAASIISIPLMAQTVMSVLLQRPDDARARPSNLIKDDKYYRELFSASYPLDLYRNCAQLIQFIDAELRKNVPLSAKDRNNIRFYVCLFVIVSLTKSRKPSAQDIASQRVAGVSTSLVRLGITTVHREFKLHGGTDEVAKGPGFVEPVINLALKN